MYMAWRREYTGKSVSWEVLSVYLSCFNSYYDY